MLNMGPTSQNRTCGLPSKDFIKMKSLEGNNPESSLKQDFADDDDWQRIFYINYGRAIETLKGGERMASKAFRKRAEKVRENLRTRGSYGSSSDLYIAKRADIAVIGIQTSEGGSGHDTIYVLKGKGSPREVFDRTFRRGRMFPTGISESGKSFTYIIKGEDGRRSEGSDRTSFYL